MKIQYISIFIIELETSKLVDGLSKALIIFAMFDIEEVKDVGHLLSEIYEQKREVKDAIGVVLMCRFENAKKILRNVSRI